MIRNATLITAALAIVLGMAVFGVKYKVQDLDDELTRVNRAIIANRQSLHVLRAEWSHLNDPERLRDLAERHLDLAPVPPQNLGSWADLPVAQPEDIPPLAEAPPAAGPAPTDSGDLAENPAAAPETANDEHREDFARMITEALADRRSRR